MGKKVKVKKSKPKALKKSASKPSVASRAKSVLGSVMSIASPSASSGPARGGGGGRRRRRGPEYWAKKVLVEKLKKKYFRAKYGGMGR